MIILHKSFLQMKLSEGTFFWLVWNNEANTQEVNAVTLLGILPYQTVDNFVRKRFTEDKLIQIQ